MNKVLIVTPSFNHGGTNKSLYNFLTSIEDQKNDFYIMCLVHKGPYKEKFKKFKVLPENFWLKALGPLDDTKGIEKIKLIFSKIFFKMLYRGEKRKLYQKVAKKISKNKFDTVVAFQEGIATEFVSHLTAKKHIAWVRCDYANYLRIAKKEKETEIYNKFDNIVCVSKYTANVFAERYVEFSNKVRAIYNIINTEDIIEKSKKEIDDSRFKNDVFTMVSIGRLDSVKRFDCIPQIARELKNKGCKFKWYIIGEGVERKNIEEKIIINDVKDSVVLLGAKNNPYPYISNSNIAVCTSFSEACPNVINEGKILHIPVITANFPAAFEFIDNGKNGIIAPLDSISQEIFNFYIGKESCEKIKEEISSFEYDNEHIKKQIEELFNIQ